MKIVHSLAGCSLLALGLLVSTASQAQISLWGGGPKEEQPEILKEKKQESAVPPAPALSTRHLADIAMPEFSALRTSVDLDSVEVAPDGIVRYVVLMQGSDGSGSRSAYYQGINCNAFAVRTYARYDFNATPPGWEAVDTDWADLHDRQSNRQARAIASSGLCTGLTPPTSSRDARRILRTGQSLWDRATGY